MDKARTDRREFVKAVAGAAAVSALARPSRAQVAGGAAPRIRFGVIGINHGHINGQVRAVQQGGGELVAFHAKEDDLAAAFAKAFPQAKRVADEREILEDPKLPLVVSASIPDERAPLGVRVMRHGKDFMVDKPGATSLEQLAEVRRVQKETRRIFSVLFSERLENRAVSRALELVKAGAIGRVLQVAGFGPHRVNAPSRPAWFWDKARFGGILCDIASHQADHFLSFTGSTRAEIVASQVGNLNHPDRPEFGDFGDVMWKGDRGTGYARVDWFTADGLATWGDGRVTVVGTDGHLEIRSNVDIGGRGVGSHLFLVDRKETRYVDSADQPLVYGERLVSDVLDRTETAMSQEHCFLATEMVLTAQAKAQPLRFV